jgi:uncharacterized membrane protein
MEEKATPPPPAPPAPPPAADSNRTLMLVLSYLGILALVPLLVEKTDKEIQWHAKNGLVLFGAWVAVVVIGRASFLIFGPLGCLISILLPFLWLVYAVVVVLGIVRALKGRRLVIPLLSQLVEKF